MSDAIPFTHAELCDLLNRRAEVEDKLLRAARGIDPMPDAVTLRAWATRLGVPTDWQTYGQEPAQPTAFNYGQCRVTPELKIADWLRQHDTEHASRERICLGCCQIAQALRSKPAGELPPQIEQALEAAIRWHQGDKYRFSNDEEKRKVWSDHHELLTDALRAIREQR